MAWLKIYQSIRQHRKILDAADALEIAPPYMIGLLTSFWLWALDNAPDGNISEISARNIMPAQHSGTETPTNCCKPLFLRVCWIRATRILLLSRSTTGRNMQAL